MNKDKIYINEPAALAEKNSKKKKKNMTFGWDVFNDDSLYKAYFKRVKKLENVPKNDLNPDERAELLV